MVEIGGRPILWHIMKIYSAHGLNDFVICLGYRGYMIKEYFANYYLHTCDVTFDVAKGAMEVHQSTAEPWRVTLVDTGTDTQTGGRLKRVLSYLGDEDFCLTYGDGLADVDIPRLLDFHRAEGTLGTVTAVQPGGRFGALDVEGSHVAGFPREAGRRRQLDQRRLSSSSPRIGDYIDGDETVFEQEPLRRLAAKAQLGLRARRLGSRWTRSGEGSARGALAERPRAVKVWS